MWSLTILVVVILTALLHAVPAKGGGVNIMPRELVEFGAQKGCGPVEDFFDVEGMINPPYVYGYLPGAKDKSAVFWCQILEKGERRFVLLLMVKAESVHGSKQCPRQIRWHNRPKGLDLYKNPRESLAEFVYLDAPDQKGPRDVRLTDNAIRSVYDGVGSVFYCYKGRWLVRQQD
jgi:hypothetical protein